MSGENISPNQPEFAIIFLSNINFHLHYLSCSRSSLTSSQPHTRARGVLLLSEVLQECYRELTEREGTPFSFHILCRHCTASCKVTNQKCTQITTFYIHICLTMTLINVMGRSALSISSCFSPQWKCLLPSMKTV